MLSAVTAIVSVDSNGTQGNAGSNVPSISEDGRYIAFQSSASNLVSGDTNGQMDIFVRDLQTGATTRVSVDSNGTQGSAGSNSPSISADGRYVAFTSSASNLVPGDTNGTSDVFVRDLLNGSTTRVSVDSNETQGVGIAENPSISADGRYIAFTSSASNLAPGDFYGFRDVFIRDVLNGTTTRVSANTNGTEGNANSDYPSISADGRYVVFLSFANDLVSGDTNGNPDVFVRDILSGTTSLVSMSSNGTQGNDWPDNGPRTLSISEDGRYVAFGSNATNLVSDDSNGQQDIFVRDLQTGTTTRVSVDSNGTQADRSSNRSTISADGRFVVFVSSANNLVSGDTNGISDVFVRDLQTGTTTRVSTSSLGAQGDGSSYNTSISADGRFIVFASNASNLVAGDANGVISDIFVRDQYSPPTDISLSATSVAENLWAGTVVGTLSAADPDIGNTFTYALVSGVGGDDNASFTLSGNQLKTAAAFDFETKPSYSIRVRVTDQGGLTFEKVLAISVVNGPETLPTGTTRVSVDSNGTQGNNNSYFASSISADGRYVAFASLASNLVSGDTNAVADVFVQDLLTGTTTRVSVDSSGAQANGESDSPSISGDGRYVAFRSIASNLVSGDTNGTYDIFVRDLQTGTTTRVSVDSSGTQGHNHSHDPSISADGRHIAFQSYASNLVSGDTNGTSDIFVRDLQTGTISRVSVDSNETQGNGFSSAPSISADGRYVAFHSAASNLVAGDTNGDDDIFVRDVLTGVTTRVSLGSNGMQGDSYSAHPSISLDGRYVAFQSPASNLVAGDTNGSHDVFVRDLLTGETTRVSVDSNGTQGNEFSGVPSISADGRFVAFYSTASNLVASDTNGDDDIFVRDVLTGITTRVSVNSNGTQANDDSMFPSINADGQYVAFFSWASDLVSDDTNGQSDIFVHYLPPANSPPTDISLSATSVAENLWAGTVVGTLGATDPDMGNTFNYALVPGVGGEDNASFAIDGNQLKTAATFDFETKSSYSIRVRVTDQAGLTFEKVFTIGVINGPDTLPTGTTRVSVDSNGMQGNDFSDSTSISADGRYVAFYSSSNNLVSGDTNGTGDVFVRDLQAGTTTRVSITSNGTQGNNPSFGPSISADGRYVAFTSSASNLVTGDTNVIEDVFVRDLLTGTTARVSLASNGTQGNGLSYNPSISSNGRYVAFMSAADNLASGDTNGTWDVFVRDMLTGTTARVSLNSNWTQGNSSSVYPSISADGRYVAFQSGASNLVSGDTNAATDIFLRDLLAGTTTIVSVNSNGTPGNNYSFNPSISSDGRHVVFRSDASNLTSGDSNGTADIFVRDLQAGTTSRVSVDSNGTQQNGVSYESSISEDGQYVVFRSDAGNLVSGDTNGVIDVFVRDLQTGTTTRVSTDGNGTQANGHSVSSSISANGRYVAFRSEASNLVSGDTNASSDIFVHHLPLSNNGPMDISLSATSVAENKPSGTIVGALSATDVNVGSTFTYALVTGVGGEDNARFTLSGSTLKTASTFDFETKSSYSIRVRVTDNTGLSFEKPFTIAVTNVNEMPVLTFSPGSVGNVAVVSPLAAGRATISLDESTADHPLQVGDVIATLTANDPDQPANTLHYLSDSVGPVIFDKTGAFSYDPATGQITVADPTKISYETARSIVLTFAVTDDAVPGNTTSIPITARATITVALKNLNEAPVISSVSTLSVRENALVGTRVGTVKGVDSDKLQQQTLTYSLVSVTDASNQAAPGVFTLDPATGLLTTLQILNFEASSFYTAIVRATDNGDDYLSTGNLSTDQTVRVNVVNVNELPVISLQPGTIGEFTQPFVVGRATITIDENAPTSSTVNGAVIGNLAALDPDFGTTLSYALVGGTNDPLNPNLWTDKTGALQYDSTTGDITIINAAKLSYETLRSIVLSFVVTDNGIPTVPGVVATARATITIALRDLNESPVISSVSTLSVRENALVGTRVGTVKGVDSDKLQQQTLTYSIVSVKDASNQAAPGVFTLDPATGLLTTAQTLNFEASSFYTVVVRATDNGDDHLSTGNLSADQTVTVNVVNVNELPVLSLQPGTTGAITQPFVVGRATITIDENTPTNSTVNGTVIGKLTASDPDFGTTLGYTLVGGTNNPLNPNLWTDATGALQYDSTTGEITIVNATKLSYETLRSIVLSFAVTDNGIPTVPGVLGTTRATITIALNDLNETPV